MTTAEHAPSGLTIRDALTAAHQNGYVAQLLAANDGTVETADGSWVGPASSLSVECLWRVEGASDPADQLLVAGVTTAGRDRGTLLLTYGPHATAEDAAVLADLDVTGAAPGLPPRTNH